MPDDANPPAPQRQFLIYADGASQLQIRLEGNTLWLTQKLIADLYGVAVKTVNEHLVNICGDAELPPEATIRNFRIVQTGGSRQVSRLVEHYSLNAILAVGYRIHSARGTVFRQWATTRRPIHMRDRITKLDDFLKLSERDILNHAGKISHETARLKAESEYETFRATQATLPQLADQHFQDAIDEMKKIEGEVKKTPKRRKENVVARSQGKYFDEKYLYDQIHRLKDMSRGELGSGGSTLSNKQFAQCWGLDETGNWSNFREDNTGAGSWTLNQSRTSNAFNEITDITETVGASWVTPVYSRAGNMTTMPQPASPASSYTATYDAWNRLVKITSGANTVSEYQYDGAKRRVVQKSYVSGTLNETRHLYYTEPSKWQVAEERVGSSTSANRQFVWGLRYIDDLILRDRDTDGNGTLDERHYSLQDANWNVTGLVNTSGVIQQRFVYTAYGLPVFLNSSFTAASNSAGWEVLYAGYRFETATSLMHVRHRVLNAALGCWVQRDPVGYADGCSLYSYCRLSPSRFSDSSGTLCEVTCEELKLACRSAANAIYEACLEFGLGLGLSYEDVEPLCAVGRTVRGLKCEIAYEACKAARNIFNLVFNTVAAALDWIMRNPLKAIGMLILIAGTLWIVGPAGMLILA